MPFYRMLRDLDWVMMGITLAISLVGVLQIYSATHETVLRDLWWKQLVWVFIGIVSGVANVGGGLSWAAGAGPVIIWHCSGYAGGHSLSGPHGVWGQALDTLFFGFHFQVSEFAKLVIVLLVARYLTGVRGDQLDLRDLLRLAGLVGLPFAMVMFLQSDLGTALTYLSHPGGGNPDCRAALAVLAGDFRAGGAGGSGGLACS